MFEKIPQVIGNKRERNRIVLMGGILFSAAFTTPWFHSVLKNDAVFTHLFYFPIILASIWWRKKGLMVAFFLAAVLITSHVHNQIQGDNDYFRAAIFILVAYVVAGLSEKILRSEKALRESEERYRNIFDNAQVGLFRSTVKNGTILEANQRIADILGFGTREELMKAYKTSRHYAETGRRKEIIGKARETGFFDEDELAIKRRDGSVIWVHISGRICPEEGYFEGIMTDITSEKAAMDALLESEKNLRRINRQLLKEGRKRRYLSERLIDLLERDRKQISMDLHDQVGQDLTTLKMDLDMLLRSFGSEEAPWGGRINAIRDKASKVIRDVKEISSGLRPSVLDHLGLVPALKELCQAMDQQAGIQIDFFCRKNFCSLGPEKEVSVYRIVQEALTNMVKHSKAQKGFVSLVEKNDMILLSIEDDGIGFEMEKKGVSDQWRDCLGLLIMEERVVRLGGSFRAESGIGAGTILLVEIPL